MDSIQDHSLFVPIPQQFHSLQHEGLFQRCLMCEQPLLETDQDGALPTYYIERIFRGAEPILEYALCLNCDDQARRELSADSSRKVEMFFDEHVDLERRMQVIGGRRDSDRIERWLEACVVTKQPLDNCHEKQILAVCHGDQLALPTAMMLSGDAVSMVMALLSKKTREWLGDFTSTHFGMPPEFCDRPDFLPNRVLSPITF